MQEFCRGLGETVTFEPSGLGEGVSEELLDFEESLQHKADKARSFLFYKLHFIVFSFRYDYVF